ncbi:hypothetical protein [Pseudoalteromonas sp.]|uniref:hypothetical protein n=1 Tax=Pseudoalteromonas sp. TaxID=53249 RepID=UPI0035613B43
MKILLAICILVFPFFAQADKVQRKCYSSDGTVKFTTRRCAAGEREEIVNSEQSLIQFAQKASNKVGGLSNGFDNTDLTYFLKQNFSQTAWSENIIRSYLEPMEAVVVVDTFRIYKLEEICQATMNWIDQYPHARFDLSSMRLEFNTGETFDARYVKKSQCDFELRQ